MGNGRLHLKQGTVTFAGREPFALEAGGSLSPVHIRFAIYGEPNDRGDNVVLLCHALSGSAEAHDWWPELFAPGGIFADGRFCIICTNILGSRYGSTGPTSFNPATGKPYGDSFPLVTIGDVVRAQERALHDLGITRLYAVLGASIGGMQALEWAIRFPEKVERCIAIGATPLSSMGLALNHLQRQAIFADPEQGLRIARGIAMCSYKSSALFDERHGRKPNREGDFPWESKEGKFDIAGYLEYQGEIFARRFDPQTYVAITRMMDLWDPARSDASVYDRIQARASLIGISSDWLFPAEDIRNLANELRSHSVDCQYHEIESDHGHDSFLAEMDRVHDLLAQILSESKHSAGIGESECGVLGGNRAAE
ncbi:MAG TPA: homoserine O-acetyltransferase [Terriglobales bacterium]|nr:homoserine O-acetyltransferase [Terriglobales bacterium]